MTMSDEADFTGLLERTRGGDQSAAAELVRRYEPAVRRAIRVRLLNPRLRRVLDSMDVCQSVLASFFVRTALGQFELNSSEDVLKLLVRMARNKVAGLVRHEQAERRDNRRLEAGSDEAARMPAREDTPSQMVAGSELLLEFRRRLTPEEQHLAEQRRLGREWGEIAAELGQTPEALRKRLARAIERVARELGLESVVSE
jgi:RNA polymerase sigma-70 factor (ECF subfamily)